MRLNFSSLSSILNPQHINDLIFGRDMIIYLLCICPESHYRCRIGLYFSLNIIVKENLRRNASLVMAATKGQGDDSSSYGPIVNDLRCFLVEMPHSTVSHVQR